MDTDQFFESFTELYHRWYLVCETKGDFDFDEILDNLRHLGIENPLNILHNGGEGDLQESIDGETWTAEEPGEYALADEMLLQQACWLCEYRMKRDEIPLGWEGSYPFYPIRNAAELKKWMKDSLEDLLEAEDRSRAWCRDKGTEIIRNAFHAFDALGIESPAQPEDPSDGNQAVRIIRNLSKWLYKQPEPRPNGDVKLKCDFYHPACTPVPEEYHQEGRPCRPLVNNESKLALAVSGTKDGRKLKTAAQSRKVFVRQIAYSMFDVHFRSFEEMHSAKKRLEPAVNETTN